MSKAEEKFTENLPVILEMIEKLEPKIKICVFLGIKQDSFNKYLKKYGIEYLGNQNRKNRQHFEQQTPYTDYTEKGKRITASKLRKKLIEQNVKEAKCEHCGLIEWMGKPIPLELHHLDFNHYNNKLENLQILCSNCHTQAHDYCNTKKRPGGQTGKAV